MIKTILRQTWVLLGVILLSLSGSFQLLKAQTVTPWLTTGDGSSKLSQQSTLTFGSNSASSTTISVNEATTYQTMDGFGYTFTEGSAEVIAGMAATQQNTLLNELFNPSTGIGISVLRISIGASDLSSSDYTYNQTSGDVNMNNFSLAGPDLTYLVPMLKKILAINPNVKILATPWTAPTWMKTNNGWVGGSLSTTYYAAYATYFVKYLQAMQAQGINVWAITPQNEPGNATNEPSMTMTQDEETNFINNNLGPAVRNAGFTAKIIAYDHNCDNTSFPIYAANNSSYIDGSSFHLYAGSISAMSTVHDATNKNVYFTEQYTGSGGAFAGDFNWHMQNISIGSTRNWAKTTLEWNLANNAAIGPHTPGGCNTCLGAITINSSTSYTRNVAYYIIAHLSKFVKVGATRIATNNFAGSIENVAFNNPDGTKVLVVQNAGSASSTFQVISGGVSFNYTLAAGAGVTFTWSGTSNPTPPATPASLTASAGNTQVSLSWNAASGAASYTVKRSTTSGGSYTNIATGVTLTNYVDAGLTNGTTYYYVVSAVNSAGTSANSNQASATPVLPAPAVPASLTASAGNTQVSLSWSTSANAASYTVKRSTTSGGSYTNVATGVTSTSYVDAGLTNGTTYYYVVSAVNASGTSANSNQASATPVLITINAFSQIEAENYNTMSGIQTESSSDTGGGSDVGFTDSNDYIQFTNVDFGTGPSTLDARIASAATFTGTAEFRLNSTTGTLIGTLSFGNTGGWQTWVTKTISISGATGIKNLYVVFQGGAGIGNVNWFKFKTATAPAAPTNLTATAGNAQASLSWTASTGATSYTVRRSTTSGGSYTDVATGISSTTYTNTGLTNGTAYYYVVAAVNASGTSSNSNQATATPVSNGTTLSDGMYEITSRSSGKAVDVTNVSTSNGARIQQWDWSNGSNQKWNVVSLGGGLYKLTSVNSGKALDVVDASTANGAQIQQWDYSSNPNQKWTIESVGSYYRLIASHSNKALTLPGASTTNGTLLTQSDWTGGNEQQWQFTILGAVGARTSTPVADVKEAVNENMFSVYPMPARSEFTISYNSLVAETMLVNLVSIEGKLIHEEHFVIVEGENKIKINVASAETGLYILNTHTPSNGRLFRKVNIVK